MPRVTAILTIILVGGLASGCVSGAIYPEAWAKQVRVGSGTCPDIDGIYQNTGEAFVKSRKDGPERNAHNLAHLLDGWASDKETRSPETRLAKTHFDPSVDPFQTVRLEHAGARLQVEAAFADGSTRKFDLPTRGRCSDSTLLMEAIVPPTDFEFVRETLALGRAEDGSLLAYWTGIGVVFILGPNWAERSAVWIRFPPAISGATPPQAPEH